MSFVARTAVAALLVACVALAPAQEGGKKYAVLVGVNQYDHPNLRALRYAENDVVKLEETLSRIGYTVTLLTGAAKAEGGQPTKANIEAALAAVFKRAVRADAVVVAFAGHGLQFDGDADSYFCPTAAKPFKAERDSLVSLKGVYAGMEKSLAGVRVLFVDACRDDPESGGRGIAADTSPKPPRGVTALFSCSQGEQAREHKSLEHGVFFHYVLKGLAGEARDADGEVTFGGLASYVQKRVSKAVPALVGEGAQQSPNVVGNYSNDPVLVPQGGGERKPGEEVDFEIGDGEKMRFCWVPPGQAQLGSPTTEKGRSDDEADHQYTSKGYWLGKYHVTQAE